MLQQIGIIGYGRFGKLTARYLSKNFDVAVADRSRTARPGRGIKNVTVEKAALRPIVILAVPINALLVLLNEISSIVRKDAIVLDVCSVKERPLSWMMHALPKSATIIGTHPLFGPDSAAASLKGRNIVLCPGRASGSVLNRLKHGMELAGLKVFIMTAAEHDKLMASTLFLTQFIGHGLGGSLLPATGITTENFEKLRQIAVTSGNDTMELFRDMYRYNRFAKRIPDRIIRQFRTTFTDVINTR